MYLYSSQIPSYAKTTFDAVCKELGVSRGDLAICFKLESNFKTTAVNISSRATGLIQFLPSTAAELGTSVEALRYMNFKEQLYFVQKYLEIKIRQTGIKPKNVYDLYLLIHYPKAAGKADSYVLYGNNSAAFRWNKGLDYDQNGNVTVKEIKQFVNRAIPAAYLKTAVYEPFFWLLIFVLLGVGLEVKKRLFSKILNKLKQKQHGNAKI